MFHGFTMLVIVINSTSKVTTIRSKSWCVAGILQKTSGVEFAECMFTMNIECPDKTPAIETAESPRFAIAIPFTGRFEYIEEEPLVCPADCPGIAELANDHKMYQRSQVNPHTCRDNPPCL